MEIIEIGTTQLLFLLAPEDMTEYKISTSFPEDALREGFARIIRDLGVSERFLSGVLVQIFDSKNGGCEMFITKIPDKINTDEGLPSQSIYIFNSVTELLGACRMLYERCPSPSSAYADKNKEKYYLMLEGDHPYLSEFSGVKARSGSAEYLFEHCRIISDNAIEKLSSLA